MARDDSARERSSEQSLLDRRSYLKLAGAAAASVGAAGVSSSSAAAASYDTIKVPANTKKVINVGSGETFENKLIDITADGAHVKLMTEGSGWTVRNVGVKGENNNMDGTYGTFYLRCTEDGEALAENIYMGDGAADRCGHAAVSDWANAGTVTIRNINVTGWSADGMYMSHAGNHIKQTMGVTQVENAYLKNNNIENCRLGTPGSYIKDSVIHVENQDVISSNESGQVNARGLWFKEQSGLKAINCDISVTGSHAVFASDNGSGTLKDCRVEGPITGPVEQVNVSGNPDTSPPDSVPMSAEAAASGEIDSSSTTSSPSTEDTTQQRDESNGTLLELVPDDDASRVKYEFTVDGSARKRTSGGDSGHTAEEIDTVTDNGDGTVTVSGVAGNGYGDAFFVDGAITAMDLDESVWTLRYDGSEVGVSDLTLPNKLVIDGANSPKVTSEYVFEISGAARKSTDLGSVQASDTAEDGKISGAVFDGKDGFRFSGDITGFTLDGPANVRVEDGA
jgi:hypothetical protein